MSLCKARNVSRQVEDGVREHQRSGWEGGGGQRSPAWAVWIVGLHSAFSTAQDLLKKTPKPNMTAAFHQSQGKACHKRWWREEDRFWNACFMCSKLFSVSPLDPASCFYLFSFLKFLCLSSCSWTPRHPHRCQVGEAILTEPTAAGSINKWQISGRRRGTKRLIGRSSYLPFLFIAVCCSYFWGPDIDRQLLLRPIQGSWIEQIH